MKIKKISKLLFISSVIALLLLSINLRMPNRNTNLDNYLQDIPVGILETSYE